MRNKPTMPTYTEERKKKKQLEIASHLRALVIAGDQGSIPTKPMAAHNHLQQEI